eukprot:s2825_g3.t1
MSSHLHISPMVSPFFCCPPTGWLRPRNNGESCLVVPWYLGDNMMRIQKMAGPWGALGGGPPEVGCFLGDKWYRPPEVLAQKDCQLEKLCLSMNCMSSYGISKMMEGVAENLDGSLREVDVASQDSGHAKTSFNEEIGGRSGPKVKSKFVGLR